MTIRLFAAFAALLASVASTAVAQDNAFPEKQITIIVPFDAGGSSDSYARTIAQSMSETLGTNVVVVNKAGAGGTIGTADVAASAPDGYTIGLSALAPYTMQPHLRKLPYDVSSFEYICQSFTGPFALVVANDSPLMTAHDLIDYAKANPGAVKYGSPGAGSLPHLAMVELGQVTGVDWVHLPTAGDSANVRNLLGKHIDALPVQLVPLANNPIRPLAVFSAERLPQLSEVPTLTELGYDVQHVIWGAMFAPKGTPKDVVDALDSACKTAVDSEAFTALLDRVNVPYSYKNSAEVTDFAMKESEKYNQLLTDAGLKKD